MAKLAQAAQAVAKTVKFSPQGLLPEPKALAGDGTALIALPYESDRREDGERR